MRTILTTNNTFSYKRLLAMKIAISAIYLFLSHYQQSCYIQYSKEIINCIFSTVDIITVKSITFSSNSKIFICFVPYTWIVYFNNKVYQFLTLLVYIRICNDKYITM